MHHKTADAPKTAGHVIHWARYYDLFGKLISFGRDKAIRQKLVSAGSAAARREGARRRLRNRHARHRPQADGRERRSPRHRRLAGDDRGRAGEGREGERGDRLPGRPDRSDPVSRRVVRPRDEQPHAAPPAGRPQAEGPGGDPPRPQDPAAASSRWTSPRTAIRPSATCSRSSVTPAAQSIVEVLTPMLREAGFAEVEAIPTRHKNFAFIRAL